MRWGYRIRQFVTRLPVRRRSVDDVTIRSVLPSAALELYRSMPVGDQVHGYQVLLSLRKAGAWPPAVEQAALLHDVGKASASLTLLHRALVVLLNWADASLVDRVASDNPRSWRYPLYVQGHHAEIGADQCRQAGCLEGAVELVRYHERDPRGAGAPQELMAQLRALRAADDAC